MKTYFTFGMGSVCRHGYVCIEAPDYASARAVAERQFGRDWAFDYDEEKFLSQIEKYGLHEITVAERMAHALERIQKEAKAVDMKLIAESSLEWFESIRAEHLARH